MEKNLEKNIYVCMYVHAYAHGLPQWLRGKESACNAGDPGLIPWGRKWQPAPVFLPGESHGQRSLAGDSPSGLKESDTTEST